MKTKQSKRTALVALFAVMVAALSFLPGCGKEDPELPGQASPRFPDSGPHAVICYSECKGITVPYFMDSTYVYDYRMITFSGKDGNWLNYNTFIIHDSDNKRVLSVDGAGLRNYLHDINNDRGFDETVEHYEDLYHSYAINKAFIEDYVGAGVEALTDFDPEHPAGSSLDDIAYLTYVSPYLYIQEGYKINERSMGNGPYPGIVALVEEWQDWPQDRKYNEGQKNAALEAVHSTLMTKSMFGYGRKELCFHTKVSDVATNNLKLVNSRADFYGCQYLSFAKKPTQTCKVRLTIKMHVRGRNDFPVKTFSHDFYIE